MIEEVLNGRLPEDAVERDAWTGLGHEYRGDFRTIAGLDTVGDAYETARELYEIVEQAGAPHPVYAWAGEEGFELSTVFLLRLIDAVDESIDRETYVALRSLSLTRRIEYRLANLQELVSMLDDRGTFVWSDDAMAPPDQPE